MRSFPAFAAAAVLLVGGACADAPTAPAPDAAPPVAESQTLGQIQVVSVADYNGDRWRISLYTSPSTSIASRTWSHSGGVGANPWGNGATKYVVDRYYRAGPGCVVVNLQTNYTDGSTSYDSEVVLVGGYTGICAVPD